MCSRVSCWPDPPASPRAQSEPDFFKKFDPNTEERESALRMEARVNKWESERALTYLGYVGRDPQENFSLSLWLCLRTQPCVPTTVPSALCRQVRGRRRLTRRARRLWWCLSSCRQW